MARLPNLPNPLDGARRLGDYIWRDPDEEGTPYSGMGVGSYLEDTLRSMNPLTQARDIWDYKLGFGKVPEGDPVMAYPIGPGRFAPKTKGLRAETLQKGDDWVDYVGDTDRFKAPRDPDGESLETMQGWQSSARRGYNLRNEKNEIVASADAIRGLPGDKNKYVPSLWVDPKYRRTGAFNDLINLITHGGKFGIRGEVTNPRLAAIYARKTDPERLKTLRTVARVPDRPDPKPAHFGKSTLNPNRPARNPSLVKPMSIKDAKAFSLALQQERALQQKGKHYPVRQLVESSRKRDIETRTAKAKERARMEFNLGMHRYNPKRRGGV